MIKPDYIAESAEETGVKDPFALAKPDEKKQSDEDPKVHVYGKNNDVVCITDKPGQKTPKKRSLLEIVLHAADGFIPLWAENTKLYWRFQENSMQQFENPTAAKAMIRGLMAESLLRWGDAAPVKFIERDENWDFEVVLRDSDRCSINGCVLATAFFPDAGRHELVIYPKMLKQPREEQIDTLIHEFGHVFGLRHFFAKIREVWAKAEIFGKHDEFSIMNYGAKSQLTDADKEDLKRLYASVRSGKLTAINGTQIKQMSPFSSLA